MNGDIARVAEAIRSQVVKKVTHDFEAPHLLANGRLPSVDAILKEGKGRCGHRALVFHTLAERAGLKVRTKLYRGHISNEVEVGKDWIDFDPTEPSDRYQAELIKHIKAGPVFGISDNADYQSHVNLLKWQFGEYSTWLQALLRRKVHFLLPQDMLLDATLSETLPNIIIRHDLCGGVGAWMGMVHEENQLGIRSVTYVPVEFAVAYSQLFMMFQHEGFEIGLHIKAVKDHGVPLSEALEREKYEEQMLVKAGIKVRTVQAHGYDDARGVPTINNYSVEEQLPYGFKNLLDATGVFDWRLADSLGVMWPTEPPEAIKRMKPGKLYYCLWHPEYYSVENGWVRYAGLYAEYYTEARLERNLKQLNRRFQDTPYFDTAIHPHLQVVAKYLRKHGKRGDKVLDMAAGWGLLGLLIHDKQFDYAPIDSDFRRIKAGQTLYQSLRVRIPDFKCVDITKESYVVRPDWAVLIGWEGDLREFDKVWWFGYAGKKLILSYINQEIYEAHWADKFPAHHYVLFSAECLQKWMANNNLVEEARLTNVYRDKFPRELVVLSHDVID